MVQAVLSNFPADLALGHSSQFLPAQFQVSFSKTCQRKRATMLFLNLGDTSENPQVGKFIIILLQTACVKGEMDGCLGVHLTSHFCYMGLLSDG